MYHIYNIRNILMLAEASEQKIKAFNNIYEATCMMSQE